MIKVNANAMRINYIKNGNVYLAKEEGEVGGDYELFVLLKQNNKLDEIILTLPIYLENKKVLKKQKKILAFYGFDVDFEYQD